jgi:hypothetical protein
MGFLMSLFMMWILLILNVRVNSNLLLVVLVLTIISFIYEAFNLNRFDDDK